MLNVANDITKRIKILDMLGILSTFSYKPINVGIQIRKDAVPSPKSGFDYLVGPHHLVIFMFENVAVPDVAAGIALELDDDPCHGAR